MDSLADLAKELPSIDNDSHEVPGIKSDEELDSTGLYAKQRRVFFSKGFSHFQAEPNHVHRLPKSCRVERKIRYALCMDIEATCEDVPFSQSSHEVIEIAIVLMDLETGKVVNEFQTYVKPSLPENKELSQFCMELTKIGPAQLDTAPSFVQALDLLSKWLDAQPVLQPKPSSIPYSRTLHEAYATHTLPADVPPWCLPLNFVWVTHGTADFTRFLCLKSSRINRVQLPSAMLGHLYVDMMRLYCMAMAAPERLKPGSKRGLAQMCSSLGIEFRGPLHSAVADARAVADIYKRLLTLTAALTPEKGSQAWAGCNSFIDMDSPRYCRMFGTNRVYTDQSARRHDFRFTPVEEFSGDSEESYNETVKRVFEVYDGKMKTKGKAKKKKSSKKKKK